MNKFALYLFFLVMSLLLLLFSCTTNRDVTITFVTNGGTEIEPLYLVDSSKFLIPDVEKEGYTLEGWYSDASFTTSFNVKSIPDKDMTLYVKWNINQYTISFDSNGGSSVDSITQDYASIIVPPTYPTKEYFSFDGWYVDTELTTIYNISTMPSENITLYAKWTSIDQLVHMAELVVTFVPSRDNAMLVQGTSYLSAVLKSELYELGYDIESVTVNIGTSYESVGESLIAGNSDVAFLPASTYAMYSESNEIEAILAATRGGLSKDSANAMDWNDGIPSVNDPTFQVPYYRSIGVAGTSTKGRELAAKINSGEQITWADLQDVKIGVQSVTSSAGRVYPSLLFASLYDSKTINDLPPANVIQLAGYGAAAAALASGQVDIAFGYADFRRDYADEWIYDGEGGYNRSESIWEETDVVYVTSPVYMDAVAINKSQVNTGLQAALEQAFINLISDNTALENPTDMFQMVKDIFKIYSYENYVVVDDSDYDFARAANELLYG